MSDISTITLPSGTTYNIKDATARQMISELSGYTAFLGVTTTALTDGATTNPITVNNASVTAVAGNIATYGSAEFIFNGTAWQAFGDLSGLGSLAYKDSVTASYTPQGTLNLNSSIGTKISSASTFTGTSKTVTVKGTPSGSVSTTYNTTSTGASGNFTPEGDVTAPTISVKTAGTTTTVKNPTSQTVAKTVATAAPGATAPANAVTYCAVSGENLSLYQLGYTTGASITTSNVTVKTGDAAYQASAPEFNGTTVYAHHTFTGSETTSTGSHQSAGTISTNYTAQGSTTATTNYFQPSVLVSGTFTGTAATITSS